MRKEGNLSLLLIGSIFEQENAKQTNIKLFSNYLQIVIPTQWKLAKVTPIPKDAHYEQVSNNRLILLLPIVSKVFERDIYYQFASYLTSERRLLKQEIPFNRNDHH